MYKIKVAKLLKLDGGKQEYAPVKERILALRASDHRYSLTTDTAFIDKANGWLSKATLTIMDTGETYVGESFVAANRGSFIQRNFPVEDASTSAIGRAFAAAGIGIDEAFASYEEMAKAKELSKEQPDRKVADALHDLNDQLQGKERESYTDIDERVDRLEAAVQHEVAIGQQANEARTELTDNVEWVNHPEIDGEPIEPEKSPLEKPILSEIPIPTRKEIAAPDSPLITGNWDKKPAAAVRKEVNEEIASRKLPAKVPQTLEEITGKGVTDHMKQVFVRLMEHGVNPFVYPERNTDKKFDAIEAAWNRGEEEFRAFIVQEFGMKFAAMHRKDVVEQKEFKAPKKEPMKLDNGLTIAETIEQTNRAYMMPRTSEPADLPPVMPKKDASKVQPKQDIEMAVPEQPATVGMKPNMDFLNQDKGGTMAENFDATGNKFGFKIASLQDRSNPSLFTRWVMELVKKGVDIDLYETYFEKHALSKDYASFENLLRTGTEEHINEFLNRH